MHFPNRFMGVAFSLLGELLRPNYAIFLNDKIIILYQ